MSTKRANDKSQIYVDNAQAVLQLTRKYIVFTRRLEVIETRKVGVVRRATATTDGLAHLVLTRPDNDDCHKTNEERIKRDRER